MENPVFRKKSLQSASSPEDLNDYIKVTSPGIWIILAAVLAMIVGFIVWGVVGKLETKISAVAVSEQGTVVCYVRAEDKSEVEKGDTVRIGDLEFTVESIADEPIKAGDDALSEYAMYLGGFFVGEWVYEVQLAGEMPSDGYNAEIADIIVGRTSPITFLFN